MTILELNHELSDQALTLYVPVPTFQILNKYTMYK